MSDLGLFIVFALLALGAAWIVNTVIALLSGEHPRDTASSWLDILFGEFRGFSSVFLLLRPRWLRWTVAALVGATVFILLFLRT